MFTPKQNTSLVIIKIHIFKIYCYVGVKIEYLISIATIGHLKTSQHIQDFQGTEIVKFQI